MIFEDRDTAGPGQAAEFEELAQSNDLVADLHLPHGFIVPPVAWRYANDP